jgi:hypothetical protein
VTGSRGRPKGAKKPAYAAVEAVARTIAPHCQSNNEAVRRAVDYHLLFGGWKRGTGTQGSFVLAAAEHPVAGLVPDLDADINGTRVLAADTSRRKARKQERAQKFAAQLTGTLIVGDASRSVDTLLGSRDTVVDQIARRLPKRTAQKFARPEFFTDD